MTFFSRSERARRLALRLLNWYPSPWRARYQREMQALLEEMPVGWSQVANLGGTCVREWLSSRAVGWPARTAAGRLLARRCLTFAALAYLLHGASGILAARLLASGVSISDGLDGDVALWIGFPTLLRLVFAWVCRTRLVSHTVLGNAVLRHPWLARLSDFEVVLLLVMAQPKAVVNFVMPTPAYMGPTSAALKPYMDLYGVWMWCYVLLMTSDRTARIWRIYTTSAKRPSWPPAI